MRFFFVKLVRNIKCEISSFLVLGFCMLRVHVFFSLFQFCVFCNGNWKLLLHNTKTTAERERRPKMVRWILSSPKNDSHLCGFLSLPCVELKCSREFSHLFTTTNFELSTSSNHHYPHVSLHFIPYPTSFVTMFRRVFRVRFHKFGSI